jgi:hypothetical protein
VVDLVGQIARKPELPYFSEFSPSGRLVLNAVLSAGTTYRAYRLPWHPAG